MNYPDYLRASNGDGPAVRAWLSADRGVGDMSVIVDTVLNWPPKFVCTIGTLNDDGSVTETSVFLGHLEGSVVMIDEFAPGYFDEGNQENQVAFIKPASVWADIIAESIGAGGASVTISDTPPPDAEPGDLWGDTSDSSLNSIVVAVGSLLFPIGQSIITKNPANPATYYGFGTWEEDVQGRTIVGVDPTQTEFDTVGETGGAKGYTLTNNNIPRYNGGVSIHGAGSATVLANVAGTGLSAGSNRTSYRTGGSNIAGPNSKDGFELDIGVVSPTPVETLPPYKTKYIWTRVA